MSTRKRKLFLYGAAFVTAVTTIFAQEAVMEEIIVEAPFDVRLQLPQESHVQIMLDRLVLKAETQRALELEIANRTPINTLLDLTKYSPIPLGGSDPRVDTFFLQNYMRADLNPSSRNPLFDERKR